MKESFSLECLPADQGGDGGDWPQFRGGLADPGGDEGAPVQNPSRALQRVESTQQLNAHGLVSLIH